MLFEVPLQLTFICFIFFSLSSRDYAKTCMTCEEAYVLSLPFNLYTLWIKKWVEWIKKAWGKKKTDKQWIQEVIDFTIEASWKL